MVNIYRSLQIKLKQLRDDGKIPKTFRLNQKKDVLKQKYMQYETQKKIAKRKEAKEKKKIAIKDYIKHVREQTSEVIKTGKKKQIDLKNIHLVGLAKTLEMISNMAGQEKIVIRVNDNYYTLKHSTLQRIIEGLTDEEEVVGSDAEFIQDLKNVDCIEIDKVDDNKVKNLFKDGAFFPYYNKTKLDLTQYGIFKSKEEANYDENCLIKTLREGGVSENKINNIKLKITNAYVPVCKLKKIAEELGIKIRLTYKQKTGRTKSEVYGKYDKEISIGLLEGHYFINNKITINKYAIENYEEIKDEDKWNEIAEVTNKDDNKIYKRRIRSMSSFLTLVEMLKCKDKLFEKITNNGILETQYYKDEEIFDDLSYDEEQNTREIKLKEEKECDKPYKIFFDFETNTEGSHTPYLCCFETEDGRKRTFFGRKCGLEMLNEILRFNKKDILLIAHNLRYDFSFIVEYLWSVKPLLKGGKLMNCTAKFGNKEKIINIQLKDSLCMISMPLRNFGKTFGLEQEKEVMPYSLYSKHNLSSRFGSHISNGFFAFWI